MRPLALLACAFVMTATLIAQTPPEPECVVLLHGIGMRGYMMKRLENALRRDGYRVANISYPSRKMSFEKLAGEYLPAQLLKHDTGRAPKLHFVTHSMGSLLVRYHLQHARPTNLGRVVMLGPPNHGSTAADKAKENALMRRFLGENLARLGTGDEAIIRQLGPADFEVGIIAGRVSINPLFRGTLGEENDGAVTVRSARLEGMDDFLVVPYSHTVMLWRREVIKQTQAYLRTGKFKSKPRLQRQSHGP